jgi:DNA-binding transcriptional MerR regulator
MAGKSMGSDSILVTMEEAAKILGVTLAHAHVYGQKGLLEPHYPEGNRRKGKRYLREDVYSLKELREQTKGAPNRDLYQLAVRAFILSRRTARQLEEIQHYLGFSSVALETDDEHIRAFLHAAEHRCLARLDRAPEEITDWAHKLLAINEEYIDRTVRVTEKPDVWQVFMNVAKRLTEECSPGTLARMYSDHARNHLRNVAYFYLRATKGQRVAGRIFPTEGYSLRLIQTLHPAR